VSERRREDEGCLADVALQAAGGGGSGEGGVPPDGGPLSLSLSLALSLSLSRSLARSLSPPPHLSLCFSRSLRFKMRYGWPHVLVGICMYYIILYCIISYTRSSHHRPCRDASGDTWAPLEHLTNCKEAIAASQRSTGRALPWPIIAPAARRRPRPPAPPPVGFTVDASPSPEAWSLTRPSSAGRCSESTGSRPGTMAQ
jgi:hypothetical protein